MRDRGSFENFYFAHYGRMVALITAVTGNRIEAEDVVQEAFARALARWNSLRSYDLPEAWVRRVALRIAADSGRRLQRAIRTGARLTAQRPAPSPAPEDALGFTPLGQALRNLPLRHREVLVLHYLADLPVEQIARDCGLPAGTVKARLAAGRRRLEQELTRFSEAVCDAG